MRVLIIGGTGFIGPAVVAQLVTSGHDVTLFHRGKTSADLPEGLRHLIGDRQRLHDFTGAFRQLAPEVVLDMFPFTGQDAQEVVSVFRGRARRVVAVSSQDVYRAYGRLIGTEPGEPDPLPLTEDSPLRERLYPYRGEQPRGEDDPQHWMDDYDKIPAEQAFLGDPALPGIVLRLPMVYGPRDEQHRLFATLKRMDDGRPAILLEEGIARWRWTRGYVENVAAALALAVTDERAAGRIYNVGESDTLTMAEWVRAIGEVAGWRGEVVVLPQEQMPAHLRNTLHTAQSLVTDSSRIRQEPGYTERILRDEALRRTIAWERANPPEALDPAQYDYAAEDAALRRLG